MHAVRLVAAVLVAIVAAAVTPGAARSISGPRVLAVLSNAAEDRARFTQFFGQLAERGFEVNYAEAKTKPSLFNYGERTADHLVLLSSDKLQDNLAPKEIIDFVNEGGNVLVAVDKSVSESHRDLAFEFGLQFDDSSDLEDEFFAASLGGSSEANLTAEVFSAAQMTRVPALLGDKIPPVLYRGIGHTVHDKANPLIIPVLFANPTATFRGHLGSAPPALVSAIQARNNARVTFVGSLDALSNEFWDASVSTPNALFQKSEAAAAKPGNKRFFEQLTQWTFHEKSVLRYIHAQHHRVGRSKQQNMYRIKDDIVFNITLKEWNGSRWVPHLADQLQFAAKMLGPYVRQPLSLMYTGATEAVYSTRVKLPDVYGVFTFMVDYKRPGFTAVDHRELVSIRPFRHDEYPRFIPAAYPYYAIAFAHMAAFAAFCGLWLTRKPVPANASAATNRTAQNVAADAKKDDGAAAAAGSSSVKTLLEDQAEDEKDKGSEKVRSRKKKGGN